MGSSTLYDGFSSMQHDQTVMSESAFESCVKTPLSGQFHPSTGGRDNRAMTTMTDGYITDRFAPGSSVMTF